MTPVNIYLGLDSIDGTTVSAAYACLVRNNTEYCVKGNGAATYSDNQDVLREAYYDIIDADYCSFDDDYSSCYDDNQYRMSIGANGEVYTMDFDVSCSVSEDIIRCMFS